MMGMSEHGKPSADAEELPENDEEWRKILTEEEYRLLREADTEPRFSGDLLDTKEDGVFRCAGCGTVLFESDESSSGPPVPDGYEWVNAEPPTEANDVERSPTAYRDIVVARLKHTETP